MPKLAGDQYDLASVVVFMGKEGSFAPANYSAGGSVSITPDARTDRGVVNAVVSRRDRRPAPC